MKIALSPITYCWPRQKVFDFYKEIATSPVDIVYLGETVCSKRHEVSLNDYLMIAKQLKAAGKEVILSTQVLIESMAQVNKMLEITKQSDFIVEANEMGAIAALTPKPFVVGTHLNLFNKTALSQVVSWGAFRYVAPIEMNREQLSSIIKDSPTLEHEVFVFGQLPLAYSARCFTARYFNLQKDQCEFKCVNYPQGLTVATQENEEFLVLNGIQTQSFAYYNLIFELHDLQTQGVDIIRIAPLANNTSNIIHIFSSTLSEKLSVQAAFDKMSSFVKSPFCDGYYHARPGKDWTHDLK